MIFPLFCRAMVWDFSWEKIGDIISWKIYSVYSFMLLLLQLNIHECNSRSVEKGNEKMCIFSMNILESVLNHFAFSQVLECLDFSYFLINCVWLLLSLVLIVLVLCPVQ